MSDTLQSVLQLCLPYLELFQMVRLSSCSLQTASFCRSQLGIGNNMLAHALLHAAVTDAAELELAATGKGSRQKKQNAERQLKQFRRAVAWLVDAVGSKSLFSSVGTDDAAQTALIHLLIQRGTPVIHLELAERLVQSGLRVSYSELVLAARAGVSGIGVWPNTMQRSGVDTDIPAWAKYAALGTWEWSGTFVSVAYYAEFGRAVAKLSPMHGTTRVYKSVCHSQIVRQHAVAAGTRRRMLLPQTHIRAAAAVVSCKLLQRSSP